MIMIALMTFRSYRHSGTVDEVVATVINQGRLFVGVLIYMASVSAFAWYAIIATGAGAGVLCGISFVVPIATLAFFSQWYCFFPHFVVLRLFAHDYERTPSGMSYCLL